MEQNIQKPSAGLDSDPLRRGPCVVDKASCIAVFVAEGAEQNLDQAAIVRCAQQTKAPLYAFAVRPFDLTHYGQVDHLATAGDMAAFQEYTALQDVEYAEELFAFLRECDDLTWQVRVLYGSKEQAVCLKDLQAEHERVHLFTYTDKRPLAAAS